QAPGDLERLGARDFAAAVAGRIEADGLERVVLVGHSMAGLTLPHVLERIPERVATVVLVSCVVPREGQTLFDALAIPEAERPKRPQDMIVDPERARAMFCSDMDEAQTRFVLERLCADAVGVMSEPARLAGLAGSVARRYVKLLRDQALPPELQDE